MPSPASLPIMAPKKVVRHKVIGDKCYLYEQRMEVKQKYLGVCTDPKHPHAKPKAAKPNVRD